MMKKRGLVCAAAIGLAVCMTGCASGQISNDYVTISQYKGVEVPKVEGVPEITDESVENNINTVREGFSKTNEITDRPAQEGDVIKLDYAASTGGQEIEGGSAADYELTIGAKSFFEGFDESIVGHSTGDIYELQHTFENDNSNSSLAGKTVDFTITVKFIGEKKLPDLTDEFVQTISQKSKTVAEYKEEVRDLLKKNNKEYVMSELTESCWEKVLENAEVKKYPKDRLKAEKQTLYEHYQKGADVYAMDFDDFLGQMDMTEEQFEKQITKDSKSNLKENLVTELIAEKAGIKLSDQEYKKAEEALAKEMSYSSVEEMKKEAPEEYIKSYILRDKVKEWVADNCVQVEESEK